MKPFEFLFCKSKSLILFILFLPQLTFVCVLVGVCVCFIFMWLSLQNLFYLFFELIPKPIAHSICNQHFRLQLCLDICTFGWEQQTLKAKQITFHSTFSSATLFGFICSSFSTSTPFFLFGTLIKKQLLSE